MKKKLMVFLSVACALSMVACGDETEKTNDTQGTNNESNVNSESSVGNENNTNNANNTNNSNNGNGDSTDISDKAKEMLGDKTCDIILEYVDSDREGQGMVSFEKMHITTNGVTTQKIYGLSGGALGQVGSIHNDMYVSYLDGKYGLLHLDGTTLIEYGKFDYLEWYSDELLYFEEDDNGYDGNGLIDIAGNIMIEPVYNIIEEDHDRKGVFKGHKTTDDIIYYIAENGTILFQKDKNEDGSVGERFYTGAMNLNEAEAVGKLGAWTINDEPIIRSVKTGEVIFDISDVEGWLSVYGEGGGAFEYSVPDGRTPTVKYAVFNEDFTAVYTIDELDNADIDSMYCTETRRVFITDDEEMYVYGTDGKLVEKIEDVYQAWIYDNDVYYVKMEQAMHVIHNDTQEETYMGMFTVCNLAKGELVSSVVNGDTKGIYQITGSFNEAEKKFENYKLVNALNGEVVYDTDEIKFASLSNNYLELTNGNVVTYTATKVYEHSADEALYKEYGEWAIFRNVTDEYKESKDVEDLSTDKDIIRVPGNEVINTFDSSKFEHYEGVLYCDTETEKKLYNIFGDFVYELGTYEED